ncbi:hypothetical protein H8S90_20075 [Olivibacter sp. SDN3]|uniref:carboxypeptidase-like regulatory domain-containing protein n=1 Tax=Olivibacter sp. SDN3 TaxID=2764720 RepID=UPI0016514FFE|nr:carboxypeptidase-like regulatory domain-containing protein [Olivibacter sp. SDN3]QNL49025.1 hypothetical protein H8S90_20075 [Olivibacter sp. SDN3]
MYKIQNQLDTLLNIVPLEKLYLQLDKSDYLLGDTIWYKAYVMDGTFSTPSQLSGILYIELSDNQGNIVKRARQMLFAGSIYGDFYLDPTTLAPGQFTLRAYTRWLQNFGKEYIFEQHITISGDFRQEWTVDLAPHTIDDSSGRHAIHMQMKLRNINTKPFQTKPVVVKIQEKGKNLFREKIVVDTSGILSLHFNLPKKQNLYRAEVMLFEEDILKAQFALSEGMPEKQYDVQFLPESGHWLANASNTLGIKAIDSQGKGVAARGIILNSANERIATFSTKHKGMGRVYLPPLPVDHYRARVDFADGHQHVYELPPPIVNGVILQHGATSSNRDSIHLKMVSSEEFLSQNGSQLLIGQVRGIMCYAAVVKTINTTFQSSIPRAYFPEGIIHFSLTASDGSILAERMVYNSKPKRPITAIIQTHRPTYNLRDSVALSVSVKDSSGKGVVGNFSMAITDNSQYKINKWNQNIWSSYYLGTELRGAIEDPGYYFSKKEEVAEALDNLLLTQGWVRYDQTLLEKKASFAYAPEPSFKISGTVRNAFGKAIEKSHLVLLSTGKVNLVVDTLTDENGRFVFEDFPPFDTVGFVIQARNKRGKSFNIGIDLDTDAAPPKWSPSEVAEPSHSWFVNLDTNLQQRIIDQRAYQRNLRTLLHQADPNTIMLEEVTITEKKIIKGSKNLNGPGEADQLLGEEDMVTAGSKSLLSVLEEKIKGFRVGFYPRRNGRPEFMVNDKKARLIFDGIDLEFFYDPETAVSQNDHLLFMKSYLEHYAGEDVLGVEIMYNPKYNSAYNTRFLSAQELMNISPVIGTDPVYIEITTRGGSGPFMRKTPGVVHFRPMPFSWPKEFYRPRYTTDNKQLAIEDLRSTIHWQPMMITDEDGKATISFYTSDRPGTYTIRMEGVDNDGNLITTQQELTIDDKTAKK